MYDIFSLLCDIGGFNGTIVMIASLLLKYFYINKFFYYTLVRELFYMDPTKHIALNYFKNLPFKNHNTKSNKIHDVDLI